MTTIDRPTAPSGSPSAAPGDPAPGTPVTLGARLGFADAVRSPCLDCSASPCCTHLMLRRFKIVDLGDVDYILYLTGFEGILVDIDPAGSCRVYLGQACGFLDGDGLCRVHSTPAQPSICVHYNSHSCQYRHGMTDDLNADHPLMDAVRARWFAEHTVFDEERRVVERPDWDEMLTAFAGLGLDRRRAPLPVRNPAQTEWRSILLGTKPAPEEPHGDAYGDHHFFDRTVIDPCHGCAAHCCTNLVFSREIPTSAHEFDFFRYCLGFPSVELAVADDAWTIVVRTPCRHLEGGRCSLHGSDRRPLRCGYYDPLKCVYRDHFDSPVPSDLVRVTREEFPVLAGSVVFDESGRVRRVPTMELLQSRMDEAVRSGRI